MAAHPTRWLAIVNPAAGARKRLARWHVLERTLAQRGARIDVAVTRHTGDGGTLAREALLEGRRHLIAVGGDGSVNEILQGIMSADGVDSRAVTLAVAPTGTGNDWSRSLGLRRSPSAIANTILAGRTLLHDVGVIDPLEPGGARRWFINVAGAGYDAWVCERLPRPAPTIFPYLGTVLRGLQAFEPPRFRIIAGDSTLEGRLLLAFVANARYCGNRMQVAPDARIDDGLLDLVAVQVLSLREALPKLLRLYGGRILDDPAVQHLRAARVRIESDPPVAIQAEGQVVARTPADFSLQPRALRVVVP